MAERYLEDFAVGQTYGSSRLQIDEERIKSLLRNSIRSRSISTPPRRSTRSFTVWQRAVGILLR